MVLFIILQLLFVGLASNAASSISLCRPHEREALLTFKMAFTVDNAASKWSHYEVIYSGIASWNGSSDCCQWDGVRCDPSSGYVTELDLSCTFLTGNFPSNSTIFRLRHLQYLNLAFNSLYAAAIPPDFGRLSNLKYLNLSNLNFNGQIPQEIGWLSQLTTLDLSSLDAEMPNFKTIIANLTALRELDLTSISISSDLPPMIGNLSKLESLKLSSCYLQGEFPMMNVFSLPKLRVLMLGGNYMYSNLSLSLVRWRSPLEVVDLSWITFNSKLPDSIGAPSNFSLQYFSIQLCGFYGDIPNWIWKVSKVILIDINNLSGSLPETLNSSSLSTSSIDLYYNEISGPIPAWLFNLPSLNYLRLDNNLFTGIAQFDSIATHPSSGLVDFSTSDNQLQGQIPEAIFELRNLQSLKLDGNNLTGTLPLSRIFKLQNLVTLDLSHNNLFITDDVGAESTSFWPSFGSLMLSSCNLGHFPSFLREQENLTALDLSNNDIHGVMPQWLHDLGTLVALNLSYNSLTAGLESLPWKKMNSIDISFNMLQGVLPIPSPTTTEFVASNNRFSGEIPSSLCEGQQIQLLDLSHNNLTGAIPDCFRSLNLQVLDLKQNELKGTIPSTIFEDSEMFRALRLSGNLLHGSIPQSLSNCMYLQLLDIGNNSLSGTFPHWLSVLPSLEVLILGSNNLQGPLMISPNTTDSFTSLRILDVSNNNLIGGLPRGLLLSFKTMIDANADGLIFNTEYDTSPDSIQVWIKGFYRELNKILDRLVLIDASRNKLQGHIPDAIGDLINMRWLNLSHNNFTGTIPPSFGNLSLLESLDLSYNRLDGQIPNELVNMNYLEYFDVSENNLVGRVPTDKQFSTFSDDSYRGNPRLCGEFLTKKCGKKNEPPNVTTPSLGESSESSGFLKIILSGLGCGLFVGSVWGYFIFWERNYYWVDKLIFRVQVFMSRKHRK